MPWGARDRSFFYGKKEQDFSCPPTAAPGCAPFPRGFFVPIVVLGAHQKHPKAVGTPVLGDGEIVIHMQIDVVVIGAFGGHDVALAALNLRGVPMAVDNAVYF